MRSCKVCLSCKHTLRRRKARKPSSAVIEFNKIVYDYFAKTFGVVSNSESAMTDLKDKYSEHTNEQLKSDLKHPKETNSNEKATRYAAKLLRSKLNSNIQIYITRCDDDEKITRSFWSYCRRSRSTSMLQINKLHQCLAQTLCYEFFPEMFKRANAKPNSLSFRLGFQSYPTNVHFKTMQFRRMLK